MILQPAWIIDAAKYLIHERAGEDLNDHLRDLELTIRNAGPSISKYYEDFKKTGILRKQVLEIYLWGDGNGFSSQNDYTLLVKLFEEFKILRRKGDSEFFVPAMLPNELLPDQYVKNGRFSKWWLPNQAVDKAAAHSCDNDFDCRRALMGRIFKVFGRFPFNFMPELLFSLSEDRNTVRVCSEDRTLAGCVLTRATDTVMKEWVIVSTPNSDERKNNEVDEIRVLGFVEIRSNSAEGSTDWELFQHVTQVISEEIARKPHLSVTEEAICVDGAEKMASEQVTELAKEHYCIFRFDNQEEDQEVRRDLVLPGQKCKIKRFGSEPAPDSKSMPKTVKSAEEADNKDTDKDKKSDKESKGSRRGRSRSSTRSPKSRSSRRSRSSSCERKRRRTSRSRSRDRSSSRRCAVVNNSALMLRVCATSLRV